MKNSKAILFSAIIIVLFSVTMLAGCKKETKATCTDGKQNGTETGVDCGGGCSACNTTTGTCSDGIQNQNETGVDCGGSCAACVPNGKIKSIVSGSVTNSVIKQLDSVEYSYDAQGRITIKTIVFNNPLGSGTDKYIFTYSVNSVISQYFSPATSSTPSSFDTIFLNAQGQETGYSGHENIFSYDAEGYLISFYAGSTVVTRSYTNGNLTTSTYNGSSTTCAYLNDKLEYRDYASIYFQGKGNKNLTNVITLSSGSTDTYTYEYDSKGRVTKQTNVTSTDPVGDSHYSTYTYVD